jgi:lactoylglutathione lyase
MDYNISMHIEHIALWTDDLERLRFFYETWFEATAGNRYTNESTGFTSYFLTFPSGARLEIMRSTAEGGLSRQKPAGTGYAHIAFSTGSEEAVNTLTQRLQEAGHTILDGPRRTGDGYYESLVLDPDGNRVEITV